MKSKNSKQIRSNYALFNLVFLFFQLNKWWLYCKTIDQGGIITSVKPFIISWEALTRPICVWYTKIIERFGIGEWSLTRASSFLFFFNVYNACCALSYDCFFLNHLKLQLYSSLQKPMLILQRLPMFYRKRRLISCWCKGDVDSHIPCFFE